MELEPQEEVPKYIGGGPETEPAVGGAGTTGGLTAFQFGAVSVYHLMVILYYQCVCNFIVITVVGYRTGVQNAANQQSFFNCCL